MQYPWDASGFMNSMHSIVILGIHRFRLRNRDRRPKHLFPDSSKSLDLAMKWVGGGFKSIELFGNYLCRMNALRSNLGSVKSQPCAPHRVSECQGVGEDIMVSSTLGCPHPSKWKYSPLDWNQKNVYPFLQQIIKNIFTWKVQGWKTVGEWS